MLFHVRISVRGKGEESPPPFVFGLGSADLGGGLGQTVDQDGAAGGLDLVGAVVVSGAEGLDLSGGLAYLYNQTVDAGDALTAADCMQSPEFLPPSVQVASNIFATTID